MNEEFITEKGFYSRSNHGPISKTISLMLFVLSIIVIKMTKMWFLIPFSLVLPAVVFHVVEYRNYRKWRKEMVATENTATAELSSPRTIIEETPCGVVELC